MYPFQVGPRHHPHTVRLKLRPGAYEKTPFEIRRFGDGIERLLTCPPGEAWFELCMPSDSLYFRGWDLHCALRRIAPLVEDTRWFQWDGNRNAGAWLDEFAVVDGHVHLTRTYLPRGGARDRLDFLRELVRRCPADTLLAEAVERKTADWHIPESVDEENAG